MACPAKPTSERTWFQVVNEYVGPEHHWAQKSGESRVHKNLGVAQARWNSLECGAPQRLQQLQFMNVCDTCQYSIHGRYNPTNSTGSLTLCPYGPWFQCLCPDIQVGSSSFFLWWLIQNWNFLGLLCIYIYIHYHILSYIIIYYHILSYIIIYYHILSYIIIHYHTLSYIIIHYHTLSYIIIYYHILSYIIIHYHTLSYIIIYYHILSYIIIYYHILSYIIIYYHILSYINMYYIVFSIWVNDNDLTASSLAC